MRSLSPETTNEVTRFHFRQVAEWFGNGTATSAAAQPSPPDADAEDPGSKKQMYKVFV
jgi:hypothetical protein